MSATNGELALHPRRRGGLLQSRAARRLLDGATYGAALSGALTMVLLLLLLLAVTIYGAWPAMRAFGWSFLTTSSWNPVTEKFGAWPVIYGTLVSSLLAVVIAVPISVGAAIFLVRIAPRVEAALHIARISSLASFLIELLAAIPSITYGLWGVFVLVPFLQSYAQPWLDKTLGQLPVVGEIFHNYGSGYSMFAGGIILAIMITPIITAVTRDVLQTVPPELEQGAVGLGATWWQSTQVVLSYAKMGILGAVILGLARALGETMAVTMVIGNTVRANASIFRPAQTIASLLANQFAEADSDMFVAALVYTALLLLVVTMLVNGIARVMVMRVARRGGRR